MRKSTGFIFFATAMATLLAGCSKSPQATLPLVSAAQHVSDIEVTDHVKTALHQNELTKGYLITVVTLNGDVRMTGTLDNQAQIDEALRVARAADGAHTIHDELTIKK